jgi:hypothetical protein
MGRGLEINRARTVGGLEGVEAAADHEARLLADHVAHGANLAREAIAFAQQACGGIGAAVAELRKLQRHDRKPGQVVDQGLDLLVARQAHAHRPALGQQGFALGLEAGQGDDDVAGGDVLVVGDVGEGVFSQHHGAVFELNARRHRRPP